jgi:hypothetical protein
VRLGSNLDKLSLVTYDMLLVIDDLFKQFKYYQIERTQRVDACFSCERVDVVAVYECFPKIAIGATTMVRHESHSLR